MGLFSLNTNVESQSSLKPNTIHDVIFKGVEAKEVGKEGGQKYQVIEIKYEKENGQKYSQTIFKPTRKEDAVRQTNTFGGESPSTVEQISEICRQLIAAINPEFYAKFKAKEPAAIAKYNPNNWIELGKQLAAIVNPNIGKKTQIKLLSTSQGLATMPGFPLQISKSGGVYCSTVMIGDDLSFTKKELEKIQNQKEPKKSDMPKENAIEIPDEEEENVSNVSDDLPSSDDDLPF